MLGPRIAVLRRSTGMSQGELAQRLQVSSSAISMYEQGRREPSAEILVAMARTFGVTVDYLLTGEPMPGEQDAVTDSIKSTFRETDTQLDKRPKRPLSREEAAVLFAALLMDA